MKLNGVPNKKSIVVSDVTDSEVLPEVFFKNSYDFNYSIIKRFQLKAYTTKNDQFTIGLPEP